MADYTTLNIVKNYLRISASTDDDLLEDLITTASRMIDDHCGRRFVAENETRRYDATGPHIIGRLLLLDDDLLSLTTLINGDGSEIDAEDVILRPTNSTPCFGISLKQSSGLAWTYDDSPEGAISVEGEWGFSENAPEPVAQAAIRLTAWLYRQRDTGVEGSAGVRVDDRGGAIPPARLPRDVIDLLSPYIYLRMKAAG
jgi:hypothetical protein